MYGILCIVCGSQKITKEIIDAAGEQLEVVRYVLSLGVRNNKLFFEESIINCLSNKCHNNTYGINHN